MSVERRDFVPSRIWPFDPETDTYGSAVDRDVDPEAWTAAVLADAPLVTQWDDGAHTGPEPGRLATSSASMPKAVETTLRALDARPGSGGAWLDIGTGTGYTAARIAETIGPSGFVTTVEVDPGVATVARTNLERAGGGILGAVSCSGEPPMRSGDSTNGWTTSTCRQRSEAMRIGITGHRGLDGDLAADVRQRLVAAVAEYDPSDLTGVSCIADGPDAWFARVVLAHGGKIEAVVPAERYREALPSWHHEEYDALLGSAERVHLNGHQESDEAAYMAGSESLVDLVDVLVAVWDGKPARGYGGTADVVAYAREQEVPVVVIWPDGAER